MIYFQLINQLNGFSTTCEMTLKKIKDIYSEVSG